jgi:putative ubiquitin-RnfH superfamily antitoxin RatB of RatAB toxin-antitoxin module
MTNVEIWLYGPMAHYAGEASQGSFAQLNLELEEGSTVGDLVHRLGIPAEERGITFVNGNLAALPGLQADLNVVLHDGDRVGISHRKSMWPMQYRFGAQMTSELQETFRERGDRGVHHTYTLSDDE